MNRVHGGSLKKSFGSAFGLHFEPRVPLQNAPLPVRFFLRVAADLSACTRFQAARDSIGCRPFGVSALSDVTCAPEESGPFTRYII